MTDVSFSTNYDGIHAMLNMPEIVKTINGHADRVMGVCVATAPVGSPAEPDKHAGRYKAAFHTAVFMHHGAKKDRPEGYVINDSPDAFWVEFGHHGREPYATIRRALFGARI